MGRPTLQYLRYWHTRYNRLVFDGILLKPDLALEDPGPEAAAWCFKGPRTRIVIGHNADTLFARRLLLHEMVHQWQAEQSYPLGHGPSFQHWVPIIERITGLEFYQ